MPFDQYRELLRRTAVFNLLLDRCVRSFELETRSLQLGVIVVDDRLEARAIREKILRGASFDVLAEQHSIDRSGSSGGILAPIPLDARHPLYPLAEDAAGMKPGEISEVREFDSPQGKIYRLIKVTRIIEPFKGTYAEVAPKVEESLEENPVDLAAIQYWLECMNKDYAIEVLNS
jgi:parvulin-like peptidyl-prolyl isomerase